MKIISFSGGLGNQIFEYANFSRLKKKFPRSSFFAYYPHAALDCHNGLEINKRFKVNMPPCTWYSDIIGHLFFYLYKLNVRLNLPKILIADRFHPNDKALYHADWFGDKIFVPEDFSLEFILDGISSKNTFLAEEMRESHSVSIHVRRGDFLSVQNKANYGGICTDRYYKEAISEAKRLAPNVHFYIFSDDIEYVKTNFNLPSMTIVDWNKGEDSFYDMYLMSQCEQMILANSTFSYWAARFNKRAKNVFCPTKWMNLNKVDITPNNWNQIES